MPGDEFKTTYTPGSSLRISGSLLNREHRTLNAATGERQGTHIASRSQGTLAGETQYPPTIIGVAKIVNATNTCAVSSDPGGGTKAPCPREGLYLARFRYYDSVTGQWEEYEEDLPLDTSPYYASDPTNATKSPVSEYPEVRAAHIPGYVVGDVTPAYWDELRHMLVPIQSPYQDQVQAEFITKTTQSVPQAGQSSQGNYDSFASVYLEMKRPTDVTWIPLSALSWRVPYLDSLRTYHDSRSGFAFFSAPHGTYLRLRMIASSADVALATNWSQVRFFGAGRKNSQADFVPYTIGTVGGGSLISGWALRADTSGRFGDSPFFKSLQGNIFQVQFDDPLDEWVVGCQFSTILFNDLSNRNFNGLQFNVVTSIDCEEGKILEYCTRTIFLPAELSNRITLGQEVCFDCDKSTSSMSCSTDSSSFSSFSTSSQSIDESSSSQSKSESSSSRTECCSGGECLWEWLEPEMSEAHWEHTDTCTSLPCDPDCECVNGPTRDGAFAGEVWTGHCVPTS